MRHVFESARRTNTARIAALALPNCEIRDYGARGRPFDPEVLREPDTWLLYPGGSAAPGSPSPRTIVVLDGSWGQARRMFLRLPALARMPRLSFEGSPGVARLRKQPLAGGMATLEAIAHAVEHLEGADAARPLHALFTRFVALSVADARSNGRRPQSGGTSRRPRL